MQEVDFVTNQGRSESFAQPVFIREIVPITPLAVLSTRQFSDGDQDSEVNDRVRFLGPIKIHDDSGSIGSRLIPDWNRLMCG